MADKKNRDHLQVTGKFYHTSPYVPVLFCCNFFGYIHMVNSTGIHDVTSYLAKNSIDEKFVLSERSIIFEVSLLTLTPPTARSFKSVIELNHAP
jgi:hypothetical protein